jgi:DNA repair exonuclease SbcCD nuclease subunit
MKFLDYTDPHLSNVNPKKRADNYSETCLNKLEWVYQTAEDEGCDFIICSGDVFNEPTFYRYDLLHRFQDILLKYPRLDTYCNAGEHDLVGHSFQNFEKSPLYYLCQKSKNFVFIKDSLVLDGGIVLTSKHKTIGIEGSFPDYSHIDKSKYNILICHDLVGEKKILGKGSRMLLTSEHKVPFDLVCCGDLHDGFEPHKTDNTWWVNPGSLLRRTSRDINRKPKVYVIDINKGSDPIIKTVYYPEASKGSDIFTKVVKKEEVSRSGVSDVVKALDAKKVEIKKFETLYDEYILVHPVDPRVMSIFNDLLNKTKET